MSNPIKRPIVMAFLRFFEEHVHQMTARRLVYDATEDSRARVFSGFAPTVVHGKAQQFRFPSVVARYYVFPNSIVPLQPSLF